MPDTMRAVVYHRPHEVTVEDRPVPEPGPHDVVLRVSHCGVCGSDMHMFLDGWAPKGTVGGHEFSGTVVAVGDAVTSWSVGDEVIGGPSPRCGRCEYCLAGRPSLCNGRNAPGLGGGDGAFADYVRAPERALRRVPPGLSLRAAALTEPLAVSLHALTQGDVRAGQRVLVIGGGPIGALSAAAALARGVSEVVVSEPLPGRRKLAERLGARAVTPDDLAAPRSPDRIVDEPFDVVIESSGKKLAMEAGLAQLKRGGRLVLVGAGIDAPTFDNNRVLLNELVITGAFVYDADGFERALELLTSESFPTDVLLEDGDVALEDMPETIERMAAGDLPAKVLIAPRRRAP